MQDEVVRLKVVLADTDPPIWRRIEVRAATTLKMLHPILQAAMGWDDDHLFQFRIGRHSAGGGRASLAGLAAQGVKRLSYFYDMGDSWEHDLHIEKILTTDPAIAYPRFIDGAGCCPPEDCGGIPGFYALLEALADPKHENHDDMLEWHGGPFDESALDENRICKDLAKIAKSKRRGGAAARAAS